MDIREQPQLDLNRLFAWFVRATVHMLLLLGVVLLSASMSVYIASNSDVPVGIAETTAAWLGAAGVLAFVLGAGAVRTLPVVVQITCRHVLYAGVTTMLMSAPICIAVSLVTQAWTFALCLSMLSIGAVVSLVALLAAKPNVFDT